MPKTLRARIIALFTLQILIIILVGGFYLDFRLRQTLEDELANKLQTLALAATQLLDSELVASLTLGDEQTRTYASLLAELKQFKQRTQVRRVYVFSSEKKSLLDSEPNILIGQNYAFLPIANNDVRKVFSGQAVSSTLFEGRDGKLYKSAFAPVGSGRNIVAALAVEGSAQTLEAMQTVRRDLLLIAAGVLVASLILAVFFAERITTPIAHLKSAAERIARGDYESPIDIGATGEIGFLEHTLEEMRKAVIQRDTRQKTMLAGVAHEIRNPLGGIELFAGLLASEVRDTNARTQAVKIQKEVRNLKKIVNDFLNYAKPNPPKKDIIILQEVFEESCTLLAPDLKQFTIEFKEKETQTQVFADPQHMKQIFINLLKNSVEAMNGKGAISVVARDEPGAIKITFSDSGPGIPVDVAEAIFDPFFTTRKDGTGMGLAIVQTLITENGGHIRCQPNETGAIFEIVFPAKSGN